MPSAGAERGGQRRWAEVAVTVHGEAVEAVTAFLAALGAGGTVLRDEAPPAVTVVAYFPDDARLEERLERVREGVASLGAHGLPAEPARVVTGWVHEEDWAHGWKAYYHPLAVGRRFLIRPTWETADGGDRIEIVLDPGMAFGTGQHPTTRQCLELLETYVRPGDPVADVGTGSGVLAIAAALLGAARVAAVDVESVALEAAASNVAANGVGDRVVLALGSAAEAAAALGEPARVVAANLTADVLVELAHDLAALVEPGGVLIAAGIIAGKEARVRDAFKALGLRLEERRHDGEWVAMALRREA